MKGMQGLIVAALLGVLAVVMNFVYLSSKDADQGQVRFLAIKTVDGKDIVVKKGDVFKDEHLVTVLVPEANAARLKLTARLEAEKATVLGTPATRDYEGGDLILKQDYRTPAKLELSSVERMDWIPVNSESFVPELIDPGDSITFIVPAPPGPTPAEGGSEVELIGPFEVRAMGNRLGKRDVMQAHRIPLVQERKIGIVTNVNDEEMRRKMATLLERVHRQNIRNIGVRLDKKGTKEE